MSSLISVFLSFDEGRATVSDVLSAVDSLLADAFWCRVKATGIIKLTEEESARLADVKIWEEVPEGEFEENMDYLDLEDCVGINAVAFRYLDIKGDLKEIYISLENIE